MLSRTRWVTKPTFAQDESLMKTKHSPFAGDKCPLLTLAARTVIDFPPFLLLRAFPFHAVLTVSWKSVDGVVESDEPQEEKLSYPPAH